MNSSPSTSRRRNAQAGASFYFFILLASVLVVVYTVNMNRNAMYILTKDNEIEAQVHQVVQQPSPLVAQGKTSSPTAFPTKSPVAATPLPTKLRAKDLPPCIYSLWTFNHLGKPTSASKTCITSNAELLNILESIAMTTSDFITYDHDWTVSVAISSVPSAGAENGTIAMSKLDELADVVDDFLTPRLEWRIMAERFVNFNTTNDDEVQRGDELFYDPAIFVDTDNVPKSSETLLSKFAIPTALARKTLLSNLLNNADLTHTTALQSLEEEEELLAKNQVDFLLVRVLDDKVTSVANGLRKYQFPTAEYCSEYSHRTQDRVLIRNAGGKDFLGALTSSNIAIMKRAIQTGIPFVNNAPPVWAMTYNFDNCDKANGYECGFLPIYGGPCLQPKVSSALKCLSQFKMGPNQRIVLPKNGIPQQVCDDSKKEVPAALAAGETFDVATYIFNGPPKAFQEWCPSCSAFGGPKAEIPTPEMLKNPEVPLGYNELTLLNKPLLDYTFALLDEATISQTACTLEAPPLKCEDRVCCAGEVKIPQNILKNPTESDDDEGGNEGYNINIIESALSSFLTRFNRKSRHRIANLHQPRTKAMDARNQGWKNALATGNCATLHIRRGDNIDRCAKGSKQFCSMNLTLSDYMYQAEPMLEQLDHAKHVFIMTDDPDIVSDDRLRPYQEKGYLLEVISGYNQYSTQTYSDWDPFIESLHAAKACRAVVGHYISTVSKLVFRSMCTRWGECPLVNMMEHNFQ